MGVKAELYPSGEAELAEMVRRAAAARVGLEIVGGGTRLGIGRPVEAGQRLSLGRLTGVSLYEPASLTIVAGAGTPLAEVEAALAREGQYLPFEPADYRALLGSMGQTSIGGVFAAGISGPRRTQVGACRDAAIGVRFVGGSGEILKSGGRVMKNVTGYDLVKLLCGSYGTLGIVTEIAFKVLPKPEKTSVLLMEGLDDARAVDALSTALASPYGVTGAAHTPKGVDGDPVTMIRIEGFEASVDYRAGRLRDELAPFGDIAIESRPERTSAGWKCIRDVETFAGRPGAVWRLSVKPSDGPSVVADLRRSLDVEALYDWGGGLVWLLLPEEGDAGAAAIRGRLARSGGHATLIRASEATRCSVPVFQPETPGIAAISAGLRRQFDPAAIFNPGRMGAEAPRARAG